MIEEGDVERVMGVEGCGRCGHGTWDDPCRCIGQERYRNSDNGQADTSDRPLKAALDRLDFAEVDRLLAERCAAQLADARETLRLREMNARLRGRSDQAELFRAQGDRLARTTEGEKA